MLKHLHDGLPFLLNRIAATIAEAVNREFQPMGLNLYAVRVLILLYLDSEHTVGGLAQSAALEQSTISHILRRLEQQGLIERVRQKQDNRSVMVLLTDEGKKVGAKCWKAVQRHDALLRRGLDPAAGAQLEQLLKQLYENVPLFQGRDPGRHPGTSEEH
ncbi:MAG: MarR family transcriptional regulator [Pigmentiphaga sp.]|uniref:MarR family winged helix-turn-helix transcriptional regulator n=1 Tax=Pigmentiphaga sp. TaxID=1977564 RepID=UPI0029B9463D|nr:MarR family transcriptional regulator [Pigmentiphaga sp.]MDX3907122.1 MarR family transcriptional regulator [Pigmentiphaga sp.]